MWSEKFGLRQAHGTREVGMELTKDDERARRLCSLALEFMNATRPIPSPEVARTFYPDLSPDSFRRAFSRDRETLFSCGVSIEDVRSGGGESRWFINEQATFVQGTELGALDAAALEVACQPLLDDPAFPLESELRMALAKIANAFAEPTSGVATSPEARHQSRQLSTLLSCTLRSHGAKISYTDAQGRESTRLVAPFSFFELWGRLYLVAGRLDENGDLVEGGTRTYRVERVAAAEEAKSTSFQVPDDFCVQDWRKLPFQMGPAKVTGVFQVPEDREADVRPASLGQGRFGERDGVLVWEVPIADVSAAASWAVAQGIQPMAPTELVDAWKSVFEGVLAHA